MQDNKRTLGERSFSHDILWPIFAVTIVAGGIFLLAGCGGSSSTSPAAPLLSNPTPPAVEEQDATPDPTPPTTPSRPVTPPPPPITEDKTESIGDGTPTTIDGVTHFDDGTVSVDPDPYGYGPWLNARFTTEVTVGDDHLQSGVFTFDETNIYSNVVRPANLIGATFRGNVHGSNWVTRERQSGTIAISMVDHPDYTGERVGFTTTFTGIPALRDMALEPVLARRSNGETQWVVSGRVNVSARSRSTFLQSMDGAFYGPDGDLIAGTIRVNSLLESERFFGGFEATRQ